MKRTPVEASRRRTASTTSRTGPQTRLVQYLGVAKGTTNGRGAASEPAIEYRSRARSGGRAVVRAAAGAFARVGVPERGAFAPTAGTGSFELTSKTATPLIRAPTGRANTQ